LIGAGVMARAHAQALCHSAGGRLVAVADSVVERARDVAQMCDAQPYADYRDMLDGVDAVWICTPPFLHREQAETCAAAGKHLFVEKPLALDIADCEAMIDAARTAGVKLTVGHVFHFYPVFQEAYRRFEAGELGDLVTCWCKRLAYPTSPRLHAPDLSRRGAVRIGGALWPFLQRGHDNGLLRALDDSPLPNQVDDQ
jgi:predicted dehydrogenase